MRQRWVVGLQLWREVSILTHWEGCEECKEMEGEVLCVVLCFPVYCRLRRM